MIGLAHSSEIDEGNLSVSGTENITGFDIAVNDWRCQGLEIAEDIEDLAGDIGDFSFGVSHA